MTGKTERLLQVRFQARGIPSSRGLSAIAMVFCVYVCGLGLMRGGGGGR